MMEDDSGSCGSSSRAGETTSNQTTHTGDDGSTTIIIRETHPAFKTRFAMIFSIVLCTVVSSVTIFVVAMRSDVKNFELEYKTRVEYIYDLVHWKVQYYMALSEQLSASVTVGANAGESSFPFVTLENFEISAGYTRGMSGMLAAGYAPFVTSGERRQWEEYSMDHQNWLRESHLLRSVHPEYNDPLHGYRRSLEEHQIPSRIYRWANDTTRVSEDDAFPGVYAPIWQISPPSTGSINMNIFSDPLLNRMASTVLQSRKTVMSRALNLDEINEILFGSDTEHGDLIISTSGEAHFFLMSPVFDSFHGDSEIVGVVFTVSSLAHFMDGTVQGEVKGIVAVISDSCSRAYTFRLNDNDEGRSLELAATDVHNPKYEKYAKEGPLNTLSANGHELLELCAFTLALYPSDLFRAQFNSKNKAFVKVCGVLVVCLCSAIALFIYDKNVTQRHVNELRRAKRTEELVGTLFPAAVRDRILKQENEIDATKDGITDDGGVDHPIADFFPHTSLMFADISGFTAWSSVRDPSQVFELLETIYAEFDALAKKRRVFKVETVGDCYVAACGLPKPRRDHAVTMARFAKDCLRTMDELGPRLETRLGPETAALKFRIGCHSGPVTAGVLRADNARYQIFGDTVNTAARMEHTGVANRIQLSSAMADLLIKAGKEHWVAPREETVVAKGKGELQTYWLLVNGDDNNTHDDTTSCSSIGLDLIEIETAESCDDGRDNANYLPQKTLRMVDWNTEVLARLLNKVVARRNLLGRQSLPGKTMKSAAWNHASSLNATVLSEVEEIIRLPPVLTYKDDTDGQAQIDDSTYEELRDYIMQIARHYRKNPFHSFDHASHVAMSVIKMMNRIVAPQELHGADANTVHSTTYGIASDPLTQFACVFSALIHDCDHPGVPNSQLAVEDVSLCKKYGGQSLAEQRSVDLAWALLLGDKYQNLRRTLCVNLPELKRFRQLLVNSVMATDVMDKQLTALRNNRWKKAFSATHLSEEHPDDTLHRKATIVIEHLIQASDISHTMQHWHVYRTWNEKLFREMYDAYSAGRSAKDPSETWYQGEIGFFDFYVVPLARKLKDCGVFGVSSDEYLSYALTNREEWVSKGQVIVEEMMEKIRCEKDTPQKKETRAVSGEKPSGMQKMLRRLSNQSAGIRDFVRKASGGDNDKPQRMMSELLRTPSAQRLLTKSTSQRNVGLNRAASMKALMKQVWDESDVLKSPKPSYRRASSAVSSTVMRFT